MTTIERFFLRVSDWDATWYGLGWLRPAKAQRITAGHLVLISFVLSLPGLLVALGLLFVCLGPIDAAMSGSIFAVLMLTQLGLNGLSALFWNRRAAALNRERRNLC